MPLHRSHGRTYPANWRVDELPSPPDAGDAAPQRDPQTGRFAPGNTQSRRRKAKSLATVVGIEPAKVAPYLRPFLEAGNTYALDLVSALPAQSPELVALAMDTAAAETVFRALMALAAAGDMKALAEARAWMREHRQSVITLRGLTAETPAAERESEVDRVRREINAGGDET